MKVIYPLLAVLILIISLSAFAKKEPKTQEELINKYIEEELAEKRKEEWKKCKQNIIKDAEQYVDSIIYMQVNFNIGDTLRAPAKPLKPNRPYDTLKLDTTPIIPIIKN